MSESEESEPEPPDEEEADSEDLVEAVAAHDEELAPEVEALQDRIEELESEVESLETELETAEERLERTRADFRNYKERTKQQKAEIKERATEDLVERLLDVRDNLGRALEEESDSIESVREGVELTRKQFDRVLEEENVSRIHPEPGAEVDPNRHEVMMRVESEQEPDTVASVYRPGYEMAEKILRPAQVTVSESEDVEDEAEGSETEDGAESEESDE
mgnify:CR=1 FL=1